MQDERHAFNCAMTGLALFERCKLLLLDLQRGCYLLSFNLSLQGKVLFQGEPKSTIKQTTHCHFGDLLHSLD